MSTPSQVRIRLPRSVYLAVALLAICLTPMIRTPALSLLYLIPVAIAGYVARTGTDATAEGIRARAVFGSRFVRWSELTGFWADPKRRLSAVGDGWKLRLPVARVRHLPALALLSGNRLDPTTLTVSAKPKSADKADSPGNDGPVDGTDPSPAVASAESPTPASSARVQDLAH